MEIDGKQIAKEILEKLKQKGSPEKILAAILVGEDEQSESFLKQKKKTADNLGVDFRIYKLSPDLGNDGLRKEIGRIAKQNRVGGVIVQLPLPEGINTRYILNAVPESRDPDVLSERSGSKLHQPAVEVVKEILERQKVKTSDVKVVVVGHGRLVGQPISKWFEGKCEKLDTLDSKSSKEALKDADIVISGVGKPGLINPNELKEGVGVIDFGYSYNGKLSGDLDVSAESAIAKLKFYTPTPGGAGPILVAKLFENFYKLCGHS